MQRRDVWLFLAISIICSLLMLPRILSAQFGLLDDGVLLAHAQQALSDVNSVFYQFQGAGRFIPTALLLRMLTFSWAGFEPERWYLVSTCILIMICLGMAYLARHHGFSRMQALLSIVFFVLSPSLIENFYTLSKSEIPLLLFISSSIVLATADISSNDRLRKTLVIFFCFLFLLLSFGAKETAIVLPILFLSWFAISWIYLRQTGKYQAFVHVDSILLAGSLLGCILYLLLRSMFGIGGLSSYSGDYQLFNFEKILFNLKSLLGWLIRDFPYLLPILLAFVFLKSLRQTKNTFFALRWVSWMGAWALILLPWNYLSYYLLPFSFGSALFSGVVLGQMFSLLLHRNDLSSQTHFDKDAYWQKTANKSLLAIFCVSSLILILPPAFNAKTYATEQLVFDRANWQFIEEVIQLPPDSQLFVNLPAQEEYFFEIGLFVRQILNRPDISIEAYQPPVLLDHRQDAYLASPVFINQVLPRVRALNGVDVVEWRHCLKRVTHDLETISAIRLERPLLDIGLHRLLSFLNGSDMIGRSDRNIIARTFLVYGWDMWKFFPSKVEHVRPAVYNDGVLILQTLSGDFESIPFGKNNKTPLTGDINGDSYTDLVLYDEYTTPWMVDLDLDGKPDQDFRVPEMQAEDIPLIGDWDGDGKDTPGFFRPSNTSWYLYDRLGGQVSKFFQLGELADMPITGDWNGDGVDEIGIYRAITGYTLLAIDPSNLEINSSFNALPNAVPVVGSWDGVNWDTLAFVSGNTWTIYPFNTDCYPSNPLKTFQLEYTGIPLVMYSLTDE